MGALFFFYRGELLSAEGGKLGAAVCLPVCRYSACFYGFQKDSQGVERSAKGSTYIMQCRWGGHVFFFVSSSSSDGFFLSVNKIERATFCASLLCYPFMPFTMWLLLWYAVLMVLNDLVMMLMVTSDDALDWKRHLLAVYYHQEKGREFFHT